MVEQQVLVQLLLAVVPLAVDTLCLAAAVVVMVVLPITPLKTLMVAQEATRVVVLALPVLLELVN